MRRSTLLTVLCLAIFTVFALPSQADAQLLKKVKDAAQNAVEDEAANQTERLLREAIRCAVNDPVCAEQAAEDDKPVIYTDQNGDVITDDDGNPITDRNKAASQAGVPPGDAAAGPKPGEGAWANYDFVPGDRVLFTETLTDDRVGDFPQRLVFERGGMEIVEWEGRRLLSVAASDSRFAVGLPETLPEQFTIEFDAYIGHPNSPIVVTTYEPVLKKRSYVSDDRPYLFFDGATGHASGVHIAGETIAAAEDRRIAEEIVTLRLMVDGRHAKVYVNERRIANHPQVDFERSDHIYFSFPDVWTDRPVLIGNIRVAAGGRDLYDKLAAEGRVATQGIFFDVDSDRIQPESTPTLEEIGEMFEEHSDLRIAIEGHTDSTGNDDHNLDLSIRRAVAVRQYLIDAYGIEANRLEADGFGETQPAGDNETPEGRQQNRRVELVVLD